MAYVCTQGSLRAHAPWPARGRTLACGGESLEREHSHRSRNGTKQDVQVSSAQNSPGMRKILVIADEVCYNTRLSCDVSEDSFPVAGRTE